MQFEIKIPPFNGGIFFIPEPGIPGQVQRFAILFSDYLLKKDSKYLFVSKRLLYISPVINLITFQIT